MAFGTQLRDVLTFGIEVQLKLVLVATLALTACKSNDIARPIIVPVVTETVEPAKIRLAKVKHIEGLTVEILNSEGKMTETKFYSDTTNNFPKDNEYWLNAHLYFEPDTLEELGK